MTPKWTSSASCWLAPVAESDQDKPAVILAYDAGGNMVSFEILDASKRMANPMSVEYAVTTPLRQPGSFRRSTTSGRTARSSSNASAPREVALIGSDSVALG